MSVKFPRPAVPIETEVSEQKNNRDFQSWNTERLRLIFLSPLAIITIIIILVLSLLHYRKEKDVLQQNFARMHDSAQAFYNESIHSDVHILETIMHALEQNSKLRAALTRRDRTTLLQIGKPFLKAVKHDFNLTHFNFTGPDRVNLLRVHSPQRYGDIINRVTTLQAEASGKIAYGIELGPLGTFTLRLVSPWYNKQTHKLIGYVELGMEIDQVLKKMEDFFGLEVITLVYKKFLQRDNWEEGMRALGRIPHWDRFPLSVTNEHSTNVISPMLARHFMHTEHIKKETSMVLKADGRDYQMIHLPLTDISDRNIGQMILLADMTLPFSKVRKTLYIGAITMSSAGIILFILFYWLVGHVGRRIQYDEERLQALATHDGLTGLFNHRSCYSLLEDELKRSLRHKRPTSLLMLDIDHFKQVNDTYGHRIGDLVLRELSDLLKQESRETDRVCRYGGEEMILIMPELDSEMARHVAERIRKAVEIHVFNVSDEKQLTITVSIGIASYPLDADTKEGLVTAADNAMYQAKKNGRNRVCVSARRVKVPGHAQSETEE